MHVFRPFQTDLLLVRSDEFGTGTTDSSWMQTPCGQCSVFRFCEPGWPVNASGFPTTSGSDDFVNATVTEVTRLHRYHDRAETDGTQDIASQFAAAYGKEPEPYPHPSVRKKARSRDLRTWTKALHGRGIPSLHCTAQVYTKHHDGTSTSSGLRGYPNSDPSSNIRDDQIFRVRFDLTRSGFLLA
ncbi:unnamed protein product [Tilletia controversa]|nr:unnamed protein product [Tilletia controversa]